MGKLLGAEAETLLFAAARDDHVRTVIQPALNQGIWVLCDRFSDSTRAYQGSLGKVSPAVLNAMERVTIGDLKPDLTIILDVPVEVGMKRAAARRGSGAPDRFEAEDVRFHQELREAYRQIAAAEPQRCVLIDATAEPATVAANIWAALRDRFFATSRRQRGQFSMSARQVEPQISAFIRAKPPRCSGIATPKRRLLNAYRSGRIPHAWLIGGRGRHRQGDAGLSHGAVRARPSQSARLRRAARRDAVGRSVRSGRAPGRGRRPWRPA